MPFLWSASRRARPVGGRTFSYQGCTALMPKIFLPPFGPKSVPGTRCDARSDASKPGAKSVPGTWCDAKLDASKSGA